MANQSSLEVDYLVVGAGASGLAFTDALVAGQDVEVLLVDRQHAPGGHWLNAYPFVRLHQPSAGYGVASRSLGTDSIDTAGPNAGFYERATAAGICDYFEQVLTQDLLPSGKVRFLPGHEYRGESAAGHHLVSLAAGAEVVVKVRRRVVDATYVASEIPARRAPAYVVEPGARVIPPNDLVRLNGAPAGFTVIGAGKTAMDTCCWLLASGVDPDRVRWIRPREPWVFDRAVLQPLDLVASTLKMQARWVEAGALAQDGREFARHLEANGIFMRIDPALEPDVWRGATVSRDELASLRSIERVEHGRVTAVGRDRVVCGDRELAATPDEVHVDCTAPGLPVRGARPVFEPGRITIQYVTVGSACWSAATLGRVEAVVEDDADRNRLCPTVEFDGSTDQLLQVAYNGLRGSVARAAVSEVHDWDRRCRLNPTAAAGRHRDDPEVVEAFSAVAANLAPALENLARRAGQAQAVASS